MVYSIIMAVSDKGILVYKGHDGSLYEIVGGKNGEINLRKLES